MPKRVGAPSAVRSGSAAASWAFGGLLVGVLFAVLFLLPEPTTFQRDIARFIMALAAGFLAYFFMGGVVLKGTVAGRVLGASGGFALFILIAFVVQPFDIKTAVADVAPGLLPADSTVVKAQTTLAREGFYTGPITGRADSHTRRAIQEYQASKNLKVDGFVGDSTGASLGVRTRRQLPLDGKR